METVRGDFHDVSAQTQGCRFRVGALSRSLPESILGAVDSPSLCGAPSPIRIARHDRRGRTCTSREGCPEQSPEGTSVQGTPGVDLEHRLRHATQPRWRNSIRRTPQERQANIPEEVTNFVPDDELVLDSKLFAVCLRSARSGGGCTNLVCLENKETLVLLISAGQDFARARVPDTFHSFMLVNTTGSRKRDGGARGIATGTVFRRLVTRTLAKRLMQDVELFNSHCPLGQVWIARGTRSGLGPTQTRPCCLWSALETATTSSELRC